MSTDDTAHGVVMNQAADMGLTDAQKRVLDYIATNTTLGPAPGWNADIVFAPDDVEWLDGSDLQILFELGFIIALPIASPHVEEFDAISGSMTLDHEWSITDAGRSALISTGAE